MTEPRLRPPKLRERGVERGPIRDVNLSSAGVSPALGFWPKTAKNSCTGTFRPLSYPILCFL